MANENVEALRQKYMKDVPLGFGTTAKSALELKDAEPNNIVVFNQGDIGEYLRVEDEN